MIITKRYPLYHCSECGTFFKDAKGTRAEGLKGQQSSITEIVCAKCKEKREKNV